MVQRIVVFFSVGWFLYFLIKIFLSPFKFVCTAIFFSSLQKTFCKEKYLRTLNLLHNSTTFLQTKLKIKQHDQYIGTSNKKISTYQETRNIAPYLYIMSNQRINLTPNNLLGQIISLTSSIKEHVGCFFLDGFLYPLSILDLPIPIPI